MPQEWASGRFWPRTGCTLSGSTLNCATGQCGAAGQGALDCTQAKQTGDNPSTLFEVTSSATSANYDVSLVDGSNVPLSVKPVGVNSETGSSTCLAGGCLRDLNETCPVNLQVTAQAVTTPTAIPCGSGYCPEGACVTNGDTPTCVIGCIAPCDRCSADGTATGLSCTDSIPGSSSYTTCDGSSQPTTYEDLYCAKGYDGNAMASGNQGTPTCFSNLDCPPGNICYGIRENHVKQAAGVCINPKSPTNYANCFRTCSANTVGDPCGGYLEFFSDGLGYTCQAVNYNYKGAKHTVYACLPLPATTGLGACEQQNVFQSIDNCPTGTTPPLYKGTGSPVNPDFVTAATQAGGGTEPYYAIFKRACPHAYSFSYDDQSGDFACTNSSNGSTGTLTGFNVVFCPENARRPLGNLGFGLETGQGVGSIGRQLLDLDDLLNLDSRDFGGHDPDGHDF